ncbi:MAG: cation:proton antiporter [Anaerolineae bacterium]|nr:cation:proton antiporter [Anaerolineae bacterium]MBK9092247.1 cation:proton antiporter [Anaerolineae bacterium]MBK9229460.1 cation:proton antiporter [Anaerolineae bacterium]
MVLPFVQALAEPAQSLSVPSTFVWIVLILLAARTASLVERIGQPAVLGELLVGVLLGNLALVGLNGLEPIKTNEIIKFLAELGVVILLFQVGLESNVQQMRRVGMRALSVALVGVMAPFLLGAYLVGPLLLPGLPSVAYLFIGAILTATSVGITARVFRDLGQLQTPEAQVVLGAAVIDDVIGLIILAVVSAIVSAGAVDLGAIVGITGKAIAFLVGAIVLGQVLAARLGRVFSKIHTGLGMKFTLAIAFALLTAHFAEAIGLAPIVGAFAAGLVLDPVHFQHFEDPKIMADLRQAMVGAPAEVKARVQTVITHHLDRHIEDLLEPLGHFLVPIFFVLTGMSVRLETLLDPGTLMIALGITIVAFAGKMVSGLVAGPVNRVIVGLGMIPRGEVGLIFAASGRALGVISDQVFSIMVIVVILSTLLTPPLLTLFLRRATAIPQPETSAVPA